MESLIEAIARVDFHQSKTQELKSETEGILSNINTLLARNEDTALAPVLPIIIFIYAIKNILYPNFLIELIPDFLDLLTMVEFYRIRVTVVASDALAWNEFYKNTKDARTLEVEDEDFLRHTLQDTQDDMRKIFMEIVAECCFIDLRRLWVTESHTDFWIRWNRYFNTKEQNAKKLASFHYELSDPDKDLLRVSATRCADTMQSILVRAEDSRSTGQSIQDVFNMRSFQDQSLIFHDKERLLDLINFYLDFVHEGMQKLQLLFPEKA